ncbi:hypothetical protein Tco_0880362 [Tanacetum coccineum]
MSNTNNSNMQTRISSALHNAIMEAGRKDRPPMLAPDDNATPGEGTSQPPRGEVILTGIDNDIYSTVDACPNELQMWTANERLKQGESINVQDLETNLYWEFGKFTSQEGESLESYYSRFYKMMNELVRNQCIVTNHQVNVQFLLQLKPEWQRFVTIVKQNQDLKNVSCHKLYDILKQHQNEVNEIRAERLAHTANPLALVAQQQPVYHPQSYPPNYTQNSLKKSITTTSNHGKAIANSPPPPPPPYVTEPEWDTDDESSSKDKEIDKLIALITTTFKKIYKPTNNNLRTSSNPKNLHVDNTPKYNRGTWYDRQGGQYENQRVVNVVGARENVGTQVVQQGFNCKEFGHVARECQKPKRPRDSQYHKEKMLLCKQEEAGIHLSEKQVNWRDESDDEPDNQELEAHYSYMAQIQEVSPNASTCGPIDDIEPVRKVHNSNKNYNVFPNVMFDNDLEHPKKSNSIDDTCLVEQSDNHITPDSLNMSHNGEEADQDDQMIQTERDLLASLIKQLKREIDGRKYNNPKFSSNSKSTYFIMITIIRGNFSLCYITCIANISICNVTCITEVNELTQPTYGNPIFIYVKKTS